MLLFCPPRSERLPTVLILRLVSGVHKGEGTLYCRLLGGNESFGETGRPDGRKNQGEIRGKKL